jgi:hypothetical protein
MCGQYASAQEWVKVYGGPEVDEGNNIFPTPDGGFLLAGTSVAGDIPSDSDFWIVRCDSMGNRIWSRNVGTSGVFDLLLTAAPTRTGGLLLGGYSGARTSGENVAALVYCVDSAGRELWHYRIDSSGNDACEFVMERREGGYYIGGHSTIDGVGNGITWLVRLDSARNLVWRKEIDRGNDEIAFSGVETPDGGAMMTGYAVDNQTPNLWLVKLDSNGVKRRDTVYVSAAGFQDYGSRVLVTSTGNYAVIGNSSKASNGSAATTWLMVVDTSGRLLVNRHYDSLLTGSYANSGAQSSDGGFLIAGSTTRRADDMFIIKTAADGTPVWEKIFGGAGSDYARDIVEVPTGYVVVGNTDSPTLMVGQSGDLLLMKFGKTTAPPSESVTLVAPSDGSVDLPPAILFTWQSIPSAAHYRFELATDAAFNSIVVDNPMVFDTLIRVSKLSGKTQYWWRVTGGNAIGSGPVSPTWSFTVGEVAAVPTGPSFATSARVEIAPNPFGAATSIRFTSDFAAHVGYDITDLLGRRVASSDVVEYAPGEHALPFDGSQLSPGTFLCHLNITGPDGTRQQRTIRMVVIR